VIHIEGRDKHEIEAFVKIFNLMCLKTNFRKFSNSKSFKIILKFEFFLKKTYIFKNLKINKKKTVHYLGFTYAKFYSGI
jgi:hypothetical protein